MIAPLCPCGNTPIGMMGVCIACLQRWLKENPAQRSDPEPETV